MLLALLLGCSVYEELFALLEDPPTPPCAERRAWYADLDGDGAGDPADVWVSCDEPAGWVAVAGDCDDADPTVTTCDTGGTDSGDTADSGDTTDPGDTSDSGPDSGDTAAPPKARPR